MMKNATSVFAQAVNDAKQEFYKDANDFGQLKTGQLRALGVALAAGAVIFAMKSNWGLLDIFANALLGLAAMSAFYLAPGLSKRDDA